MSVTCLARWGRNGLWNNYRWLMVLAAVLLLFPVIGNIAQAQQLNWVTQAGGANGDTPGSFAFDDSGNFYMTGMFTGVATFGEGASETTLTSRGKGDIYVAKYATDGTLAWVKQAGGWSLNYEDYGICIAVDGSGNSYVTGVFWENATFGEGTSETTLTNRGRQGIFVAKYDTFGTLAWVIQEGGPSDEMGYGIAVDSSGNIYVTAFFQWTIILGEGASETTLTSRGSMDIFVAKYDGTDGTLAWARQAGGTNFDWVPAIAVDASGNSYITGVFYGTAFFGEGASQVSLTSRGKADIYVAKYATDGTLAWAIQVGGGDNEDGQEIAVDGSGNSYVTGAFWGTATFGEGASQVSLTSRGEADIFVAKYATDGTLAWVKQAGGGESESGYGIAVDAGGSIYVTGAFWGTATFGEGASPVPLTSTGEGDSFVAKYDGTDGTLAWVIQAGGAENDYGEAIAVVGYWNIYVTGAFRGTATFGEGASQVPLTSRGGADIFVAKYTSGEETTPAGPDVPSVPTDTTTGGTPVMVTFDQVDGEGVTTLTTTPAGSTPPPTGFNLGDPPTYYNIETTATFTGNLQICIDYTGVSYGDESNLQLFYDGPGGLEDVTDPGYPDTENNIICGTTSHLSVYVIMEKKAYQFIGFFDPVQTGPEVVNLVKAGSVIPVKWQLQDQNGGTIDDLSVVTGPFYQSMECSDSSLFTYLGETITSGSSGLRYDYSSNQFIYNWKTTKNMAGECYRLDVKLFGSDVYSADFQMW